MLVNSVQSVDLQGSDRVRRHVSTYMAIDGNGFFVVYGRFGPDSNEFYYTRAGTFGPDNDGYLVNKNGYYLQGWPVDSDGNLLSSSASASSLETINLNSITGAAEASENIEIVANLPADAAVGDTFTTSSEIYDAVGTSSYPGIHLGEDRHQHVGRWTVTVDDDVRTIVTGGNVYQFTFSDGALDTITPATTDHDDHRLEQRRQRQHHYLRLRNGGPIRRFEQFRQQGGETPQVSVSSVSQDGPAIRRTRQRFDRQKRSWSPPPSTTA